MKRWLWALALAFVVIASGAGLAAGQSATVAVSVTVEPSPLVFQIGPSCAFVVTPVSTAVDCVVAAVLGQATYNAEGWRALLTAAGVTDPESGQTIPPQNVTLVSAESFTGFWGQALDPVGGPFVPDSALNGPLSRKHAIAAARPGFGNGGYRTVLRFRLQIPPDQAPGVYVPTWKLDVSNSFS